MRACVCPRARVRVMHACIRVGGGGGGRERERERERERDRQTDRQRERTHVRGGVGIRCLEYYSLSLHLPRKTILLYSARDLTGTC